MGYMFPESLKDYWESKLDEDFDDEQFDELSGLALHLISQGLTYEEWLDVMTPIWQDQLNSFSWRKL